MSLEKAKEDVLLELAVMGEAAEMYSCAERAGFEVIALDLNQWPSAHGYVKAHISYSQLVDDSSRQLAALVLKQWVDTLNPILLGAAPIS